MFSESMSRWIPLTCHLTMPNCFICFNLLSKAERVQLGPHESSVMTHCIKTLAHLHPEMPMLTFSSRRLKQLQMVTLLIANPGHVYSYWLIAGLHWLYDVIKSLEKSLPLNYERKLGLDKQAAGCISTRQGLVGIFW